MDVVCHTHCSVCPIQLYERVDEVCHTQCDVFNPIGEARRVTNSAMYMYPIQLYERLVDALQTPLLLSREDQQTNKQNIVVFSSLFREQYIHY